MDREFGPTVGTSGCASSDPLQSGIRKLLKNLNEWQKQFFLWAIDIDLFRTLQHNLRKHKTQTSWRALLRHFIHRFVQNSNPGIQTVDVVVQKVEKLLKNSNEWQKTTFFGYCHRFIQGFITSKLEEKTWTIWLTLVRDLFTNFFIECTQLIEPIRKM